MVDNIDKGTQTLPVLRPFLALMTTRRGLMVLAIVTIVTGLALNWSWLLAIGVAPILLSVLPCLVLCAVGACFACRKGGASDTTDKSS
jgi:hypothetical protein